MDTYSISSIGFLGKTNIPEFGTMGVSEPKLYGPCRNPWNTQLTPGGSSGGSGSAVAARMVPLASADDGGGSIRIPASACGLVGLKPSRGLMPMGPDKSESWLGLVSGHVVSRSIRDTTLILDLCKGALPGSPYVTSPPSENYMSFLSKSLDGKKIGFSTQSLFGTVTSQDCKDAVLYAMKLCEDLGIKVEEADLPIDKEELGFAFLIILACSTSSDVHRAEKASHKLATLSQIEWSTYFLKTVGAKMKASLLEWAIFQCRQASLIMGEYHKKYDFFCCPTLAYPPSQIGLMEMSLGEKIGIFLSPITPSPLLNIALRQMSLKAFEKTPNTELFNMTGQPAISLPVYWNKQNLPIGVQFVAPLGQDQLLLQLGSLLEEIIQWQKKLPPEI
jgi:amidase